MSRRYGYGRDSTQHENNSKVYATRARTFTRKGRSYGLSDVPEWHLLKRRLVSPNKNGQHQTNGSEASHYCGQWADGKASDPEGQPGESSRRDASQHEKAPNKALHLTYRPCWAARTSASRLVSGDVANQVPQGGHL